MAGWLADWQVGSGTLPRGMSNCSWKSEVRILQNGNVTETGVVFPLSLFWRSQATRLPAAQEDKTLQKRQFLNFRV